jgi:hypothetical protein
MKRLDWRMYVQMEGLCGFSSDCHSCLGATGTDTDHIAYLSDMVGVCRASPVAQRAKTLLSAASLITSDECA